MISLKPKKIAAYNKEEKQSKYLELTFSEFAKKMILSMLVQIQAAKLMKRCINGFNSCTKT